MKPNSKRARKASLRHCRHRRNLMIIPPAAPSIAVQNIWDYVINWAIANPHISQIRVEEPKITAHRRAIQNFLNQATPFQRSLCELESSMPLTFIQNGDGTLGKEMRRYAWPDWAIKYADALNECLEILKKRCFEAEGLPIP